MCESFTSSWAANLKSGFFDIELRISLSPFFLRSYCSPKNFVVVARKKTVRRAIMELSLVTSSGSVSSFLICEKMPSSNGFLSFLYHSLSTCPSDFSAIKKKRVKNKLYSKITIKSIAYFFLPMVASSFLILSFSLAHPPLSTFACKRMRRATASDPLMLYCSIKSKTGHSVSWYCFQARVLHSSEQYMEFTQLSHGIPVQMHLKQCEQWV